VGKACSPRGDSITDGWLKPEILSKKFEFRPMSSSATTISKLHGVVDSVQTSFKLLFTPINNRMSSPAFSSACEGKPVSDVHKRTHWKKFTYFG
jgi:hypothetical protein